MLPNPLLLRVLFCRFLLEAKQHPSSGGETPELSCVAGFLTWAAGVVWLETEVKD